MMLQTPLCGCDRSIFGNPAFAHLNDSMTYFDWEYSAGKRWQIFETVIGDILMFQRTRRCPTKTETPSG
jgi:hypothetical protein